MALIHEFLRLVPRNHLSRVTGKIAALEFPAAIQERLLQIFVACYGIALDDVAAPLSSFRSLRDFFIRDLKPGARPIGKSPVSPVDGFLRSVERIESDTVTQIKGRGYQLSSLLGDGDLAKKFLGGQVLNFYLAPPDYHHVHAPISGRIIRRIHIPGTLWPVNDWSLATIDGLFCVNERVVIELETEVGPVVVVLVGATNVGEIRLSFENFASNKAELTTVSTKVFEPQIPVQSGERLGTFLLGSTAVVILPKNLSTVLNSTPRVVRYGQSLAKVA